MKRNITLGLAVIAGAALGAAAVQTLHAQAKPMAYVIAENIVNDEAGYERFCPGYLEGNWRRRRQISCTRR